MPSESAGQPTPAPRGLKQTARRVRAAAQWAVPITTLVLVPKCPMCVAGYIVLLTGVGVSLSTAESLRLGALWISVAALFLMGARLLWRFGRAVIAGPTG